MFVLPPVGVPWACPRVCLVIASASGVHQREGRRYVFTNETLSGGYRRVAVARLRQVFNLAAS
jgi:hypothetical protein